MGERGAELAMRAGDSGPLAAVAGAAVLGVVMLSLREKLGWCWWCGWSLLPAWVPGAWDQRFRLAEAVAAAAMASAAPLAALERRREVVAGGGVAWIFMLSASTSTGVEAGKRVSGQASG